MNAILLVEFVDFQLLLSAEAAVKHGEQPVMQGLFMSHVRDQFLDDIVVVLHVVPEIRVLF